MGQGKVCVWNLPHTPFNRTFPIHPEDVKKAKEAVHMKDGTTFGFGGDPEPFFKYRTPEGKFLVEILRKDKEVGYTIVLIPEEQLSQNLSS